ncbi:C4-dicarboxylate ABC transporter substrate-binding protein [Bacillus sp. M6-12]|uniref:TAXI family TRAP transporter solute-binding subunit n=1 Tax=Bacillus sp. M6-12 TaxID=2054166 RepID=UPI000C772233|nr:TAXI family TRAP transporter solute-binding subunit [Bacillus sp. M6-12]PLS16032.1 C4-dicarboxylate ABC transporter substrate-binding protein [Bacillus sp. M6-12]
MKKKSFIFPAILLLALSMILAACGGGGSEETSGKGGESKEGGESGKKQFLNLVTGGTGGTYYPLGGTFADIITDNTNAETTAQSSGASAENMEAIKAGDADIAFTQTDIASYATEGKLMFEGKAVENVKAISSLYPETVQIVTLAKSKITKVEDLKGKSVSVGAPGSGTYANAEQILEIHGMTMKDIKPQNLSFDESTGGIQDGTIDAAFITAGAPTGAVEGLAATQEVVIVPIADDKIKALIEKYPYYAEDKVPANTYKIKEEVKTVAVQAMLVVRDDLDEQLVYDMTKALYENMDKVTHAKGKLIKVENALNGVGIDVHPGAKKYFDEKGVK